MAMGKPDADELALLEPFRGKAPDEQQESEPDVTFQDTSTARPS